MVSPGNRPTPAVTRRMPMPAVWKSTVVKSRSVRMMPSVEVAGHQVVGADLLHLRLDLGALLHRERTARMEAAARRRVDGRGHLAAEDDLLARDVGVGRQRGREQ